MEFITPPDISEDNAGITTQIGNNTYFFEFKWNELANCSFMSIYDSSYTLLIGSIALVNNLKIETDKRVIPYDLYFININGDNIEPDQYDLHTDFVLTYGV